jgi:N-acetylmuramic acid 6-phosphate etherase
MTQVKINHLKTEQRNPSTMELDKLSPIEIVTIMNDEDAKVAAAVKLLLPEISKAIEAIVARLRQGGRVIYIGAGTSGRLGVLDASECPPTFSTTDEFIGIMAGGDAAIRVAVEGAEDSPELGIEDLTKISVSSKDVVVGLAASGRTPYVLGAVNYARQRGAVTIAVTCNPGSELGKLADIAINIAVGPEVLTGSTRLKSGTAQKMVLNMLSTASMVRCGKTYGNLMVDVKATNLKLIERTVKIVKEATGCDDDSARETLEKCNYRPKTAIVMILADCDEETALKRLESARGFVREAIR